MRRKKKKEKENRREEKRNGIGTCLGWRAWTCWTAGGGAQEDSSFVLHCYAGLLSERSPRRPWSQCYDTRRDFVSCLDLGRLCPVSAAVHTSSPICRSTVPCCVRRRNRQDSGHG